MTSYQFHKKIVTHNFCPICGSKLPAKVKGVVGVNIRGVDGVDLGKLKLKSFDGASL